MTYAIFTEEEYLYLLPAWKKTVALLAGEHTLVGIWVFPSVLKGMRGWRIPVWYLRTFGVWVTGRLAVRTLFARMRAGSGFFGMAKEAGAPMFHAASPNATEVVDWVRAEGVDVVCITLGQIVKPPLLQAVRKAVVNKHSALLPALRGLMPVFWALLEQQPVGVTVHEVSTDIDAGRVLVQRAYPQPFTSVTDAYSTAYADMPELMHRAFAVLGGAPPELVPGERAQSYRSLPTRADVRRFFAAGHRFV